MSHDDFAVEPVPGLPETPPEGEVILWQGRPNWWALSVQALSLPWVCAYFVFLAIWRFVTMVDQSGWVTSLVMSMPLLILGGVVALLLMLTAFIQARSTMYTITNRRVAMRIGAALTMTLNLPYTQVASAELDLRRNGTGSIALNLTEKARLPYLMCWPHVRPWKMSRTQPSLRCIPDAERVAGILSQSASARVHDANRARNPLAAVAAE